MAKPIEVSGSSPPCAAFICEDALKAIKGLGKEKIDVTVTSPPYNKRGKGGGMHAAKIDYDNYLDDIPEIEYQAGQISLLDCLYETTKEGGSCFYNHKVRHYKGNMIHPYHWLSKTNWVIRQEIVWDRSIAAQIRGWRYWQIDERIYWLYKPVNGKITGAEIETRHAQLRSVWRGVPERNSPHPAPFPLWIPLRVIYSVCGNVVEGANKVLVLDPYSGSGTTGVAARLLGHDYIGIDVSDKYNDMARERIANSDNCLVEFNSEIEKHTAVKGGKSKSLRRYVKVNDRK